MKRQNDGVFARILPHLTLIFALLMLVLFVIDRFNNNMAFLTSELSKWMIGVLALLALCTSIHLIARQWRDDDYAEAQKTAAAEHHHARPAPVNPAAPRKSDVSAWQTGAGAGQALHPGGLPEDEQQDEK